MTTEELIIHQLTERNISLATAESCTGGLIAHRLTNVPGSSAVFLGGIVAYSNELKKKLLGVPEHLLVEYGAVSEPVAKEMALGVCKHLGSMLGIGVTGIAGPGGGTLTKPVGLVYIGIASYELGQCHVYEFRFSGSRLEIKQQTADNALNLIINTLKLLKK
ncbi:MAG TPA: CinA family protein [Candidatus Hydrogenedens sp.]|nr:CinA family protein [Candidatus Hydrogenedens sp.]HOK08577.1 CinA family protein [Candidatus Hydrogenedens sp.]HOL19065.1 CinA family protein [Candidatus Hydrogenedens sp.]HPP57753.1 CinA family protein [Candidatus Hydrogenedens sp.]